MLMRFTSFLKIDHPRSFRGNIIFVNQAPEPGDVIWENLGVNPWL